MDALAFIRLRYREQYRNQFEVLDELSGQQARTRPSPVLNSPVWLVWHLARTEDWYVNRFVVDQPQVLEEDDSPARLGVPETRVGTAISDAEVGDVSARLNLAALRAYRQAVHERTGAVLEELRPDELGQLLDPDRLARRHLSPPHSQRVRLPGHDGSFVGSSVSLQATISLCLSGQLGTRYDQWLPCLTP